MPTVEEMGKELAGKRIELRDLMDKHKTTDGKSWDMPVEVIEEVNKRNNELTEIATKWESAREAEMIARKNVEEITRLGEVQRPGMPGDRTENYRQNDHVEQVYKSLGSRFVESKGYKERRTNKEILVEMSDVTVTDPNGTKSGMSNLEYKTTMTRAAGFAPQVLRGPRLILTPLRRPVVADLIPQDTTDTSGVKYMEETTFTNAADQVLEGGTKPEAALAYTERSQTVEKTAVILPVSEEQIADVPQIRAIIDNRLTLMIELKEEDQLLGGNGTSPQLQGFLSKTGVQTVARGTDPGPDAFYKALTLVRWTGFADPSGIVVHPTDWQNIRLLRTADGLYIWGNPSEDGPERMWGLNVIVTPAMTLGTGLTGDFQVYSQIFRRTGLTFDVSNSHNDFFIKNLLAIRAEQRLVLVIYRGSAFCTVTGL